MVDGHPRGDLRARPVDPRGPMGCGHLVPTLVAVVPANLRVAVGRTRVGAHPAPGVRVLDVAGSGTLGGGGRDDDGKPRTSVTVLWSGFALERVVGSLHG